MVCDTCEKKLDKLIVPDKWKDGARNVVGGRDGGARVASAGPSSKIAEKRKSRLAVSAPIDKRCRICKSRIQEPNHYCNDCAYKKGICSMCGKKQVDTSKYKMSTR